MLPEGQYPANVLHPSERLAYDFWRDKESGKDLPAYERMSRDTADYHFKYILGLMVHIGFENAKEYHYERLKAEALEVKSGDTAYRCGRALLPKILNEQSDTKRRLLLDTFGILLPIAIEAMDKDEIRTPDIPLITKGWFATQNIVRSIRAHDPASMSRDAKIAANEIIFAVSRYFSRSKEDMDTRRILISCLFRDVPRRPPRSGACSNAHNQDILKL